MRTQCRISEDVGANVRRDAQDSGCNEISSMYDIIHELHRYVFVWFVFMVPYLGQHGGVVVLMLVTNFYYNPAELEKRILPSCFALGFHRCRIPRDEVLLQTTSDGKVPLLCNTNYQSP